MESTQQKKSYPFLNGGGEMGELTRNYDWASTSIGSPDEWPHSLKITVSNLLRSKFPMFLWWGQEMIQFYNDAYRPSLGNEGKHPSALGAKGKDTWPEIWEIVSPLIQQVETTGEATWMEDQLVPIFRNGKIENVYWTHSYSSVLDDNGIHGGILVTCIETTDLVKMKMDLQGSETRFRSMVEQAPFAVTLTRGEDVVIESINAPMLQIMNKGSQKEVLGKKMIEVLPEVKDQAVLAIAKNVIKTGEAFRGTEVPVDLLIDGTLQTRYFNLSYSPIASGGQTTSVLHVANDVTGQVLSRKRIEESEAKYRTLFESMDQGYCTIEVFFDDNGRCIDYRYLETNPTFERHLGISGALGKTIREIAPDIEVKWFDFFGSVALTGIPIRLEEESKALDKWFEVYAVRVGSAGERKVGVFFTDITKRKTSEVLLKENEELLRAVLNAAPNSLTVYEEVYNEEGQTIDFKFVIVNEFTVHTTGRNDLIGKRYAEEFPHVKQTGVLAAFIEVAKTGIPADFEKWYAGEGMRHWFRFIVNKAGKLLVVTTENITKRKEAEKAIVESEAKLRSILNSAPTAIGVFVGPDLILENPNQLMIEVMGAEPEIEGKSLRKLLSGLVEEDQKFIDLIDTVRTTGKPFEAHEVAVFFKAEKKTRYFNINFIPLGDEKGNVYAVLDVSVDVTDQVGTRKQIEVSEKRLSNIINQVNAGIAQTTTHGQFTDTNERFCQITGYTREELQNKTIQSITHPDDWPRNKELVIKALTEGKNFFIEKRYIRKDGSIVWVNNSVSVVTDSKGEKFITAVAVDITEQITNREKLEESEERFRSMADASPVMIWTLDENGNSTYYNTRAAAFTGHSEKELREGKSWQVAIHPDDIEYAGGVVRNAVINRVPYQMECRMQRADGEWRWLLNQGTPRFGRAGEYYGFVGSSIDVTEQKKSQQELQTALEQMRLSKEAAELGTFDMDVDKGTMHWDERCRILFGISHHGPVTYEKDFASGLHPDDRERILKVIDQLFIKSISNGDYDVEYRTVGAEDGLVRWVRAKGKVYFNDQEKPVRFIGSVLDITEKAMAMQRIENLVEERTKELAQANEQLQQTNKELQRSNQQLEEFAHAASHDLKEPVRKIHFFTNRLREQLNDRMKEDEIRSFSRIENATQRMGNLIDDLLLYSHFSHRPHETEMVDLNENIHRVLEDLDLDIEEKKATIDVRKLPVVNGYRRQLQQMFQNLISNALKYSTEGVPPIIEITTQEVERANRRYHLVSVKDTGIGFAQEYANKIFQMFTRLHGKAEYSGTGVGLSIVKKVVENHDGFIEVESEPGVGSVFKIHFPV